MNWKTRNRSFYYEGAPEPDDPPLDPGTTALLVIDVQNTYRDRPSRDIVCVEELARYDAWTPFYERLNRVSIPNIRKMLQIFRQEGIERVFARIACQTSDGRDRSLSQKKPGWNNILLPKDGQASQVVEELWPEPDEVVVTKTTDSALTGTNLRLLLHNMGIRTVVCCGIFTDQCVSSTVRSLADESFNVVVLEDCCAAATEEVHSRELEAINMIYCDVMSSDELLSIMGLASEAGELSR